MVNKKKRLFKILFFPISLLICLSIFMINSFASSGFTIESNGNIKSLNLWNESWRNGFYDTSNGSFIANSDYVCTDGAISLIPNTTYSISIVNNMDFQFYDNNGNFLYNVSRYLRDGISYTFTTNSNVYYMTFYITDLYGNYYNNDIILNSGSTLLEYFPYGYYYDGGVVNNLSLYNLFNGGSAFLFWSNNMDVGFIEYDSLILSENISTITLNDMPTIRDYLSSHALNDNTLYSIMISTAYNISSYANLRLTYNSNSFNSDSLSVKLSGRNDLYNMYYPSNGDNVIIINSFNLEYTDVMINGFYNYTSNSFNLSLNTFDSGYYNRGYSDGYNNGLSSGTSQGYASGYQVGLNEGMNTDITTNGVKTLFNSILSFPVDMIKNVFNFDFMGVNVASVIMFIISIGIVAFVLKKFL